MIYLGPAGVPISSKDHTTLGGLKQVAALKLNAMEIEFVRGVAMSNQTAEEVGRLARELKIELSVHCPYFINLCSTDKKKLEASKKRILDSVERCYHMGARIAVFHPGFYGSLTPEAAYQVVKEADLDMLDRMKAMGVKGVVLGHETTGKISAFGSLEELVRLCQEVRGCEPVVDFAHLWARSAGKIDYGKIFDQLEPLKLKHLHTHFTSMEWTPAKVPGTGNERRHLPISFDQPPVDPLVREVIRRNLNITIISESPVLEQDSLILKKKFEKLGYRF
ncbi:MAG: TIM barrel protein [Candidatus Hadarchaeum sp.]|uniref:TIM barrel protein n=1 Tax=Candidatus Hadarchaeum sp. TaxID=2883567 RepID=UPI0031743A06